MSTPRPTEADVEAAESAACLCEHSTADHAWYGCAACGCRRSAIQALLASDWLAEYQRGVEALAQALATAPSCEAQQACRAIARAEAAERDRDEARRELADLQAKVAVLADEFESRGGRTLPARVAPVLAGMIRALLPTEDDQ